MRILKHAFLCLLGLCSSAASSFSGLVSYSEVCQSLANYYIQRTGNLDDVPNDSLDGLVLRRSFVGIDDDTPSQDAVIAAGARSILLMRNSSIALRTKEGQLIATKTIADFFASVRVPGANALTDPHAIFDPESGRFFVVNADGVHIQDCPPGSCASVILLAVSKQSNPQSLDASDWYFYALDRTIDRTPNGIQYTNYGGDFDHLAVVGNVLAISMDSERAKVNINEGSKVRFIDKTLLIRGEPVTTWVDLVGLKHPTMVASSYGHPGRVFLVYQTPCGFEITGVENPLSSPTLTTLSGSWANCCGALYVAAQPGNKAPIDIVPKVQPVYRNGNLWLSRPVCFDYGSGRVSALIWGQIDVSQWPREINIVQQGVFGQDSVWRFAPALVVDEWNNMAMVYAQSSIREFASTYYTGRLAYDPPNVLRPGAVVKSGTTTYQLILESRNRFTDYFGAVQDPVDSSIWLVGMFPKTETSSATWVGNLVFQVTTPTSPNLISPVNGSRGVLTSIELSWNPSRRGVKYRLQIARDSTFKQQIVVDTTISSTRYEIKGLMLNTQYFWRVQGRNSGGDSRWSSVWNFTTIIAPLPVVQTFTATSVTTIGATLRATVNPSGSSTTAWFEWGTSSALSTFSSTRVQTIGSDTNTVTLTAVLTGLNPATTYYYRVVAQNAGGIEHGTILSFTTNTVPLGEYLADTATVLLLHLNETTGSILVDASGKNNNGSATGTTIVSGRFDKGRSFLTAGDLIAVPHSSSLNFGAGPFTIEMWVNTMGLANVGGNLFIKQGSNGRGYHAFVMSTGQVNVAVYNNGTNFLLTNKSITDGLWHHFAVVITQTSISIYIDGVLDNTTTLQTQGSTDNDALLLFGVQGGSPNPFRGVIDEIRISNKARTPQEFNTIYGFPPAAVTLAFPANGATEISKNPVLRWNSSKAATYYTLQVGTSSSFETPLVEQNWITDTSFALSSLVGETIHYWRVKANNGGGSSAYSPTCSFRTMGPVSVQQPASDVPREFSLSQNYPNPFNPSTTISFDIPRQSHVKLVVYDVLGREVRTLVDEEKQPGRYSVTFDASTLPSGVYLCRMMAGDFTHARKMVVMR